MTSTTQIPLHSVVVGVDGSPTSQLALDWALDEAASRNMPLHLMHVFAPAYPMGPTGVPVPMPAMRAAAEQVLADAIAHATESKPDITVTGSLHDGSPGQHLVSASERADTVVVGTEGLRGLARLLLGSTAAQVSAHAACPVVVVRGEPSQASSTTPRVVVGVDNDGVSRDAIAYAFARASLRGAVLTGVHAWHPTYVGDSFVVPFTPAELDDVETDNRAMMSEALAGWSDKYPDVEVRTQIVRGDAADALVADSAGADLVVVGNRGRGGFKGLLLGSVTQHVLQRAQCPVAVVRNQ